MTKRICFTTLASLTLLLSACGGGQTANSQRTSGNTDPNTTLSPNDPNAVLQSAPLNEINGAALTIYPFASTQTREAMARPSVDPTKLPPQVIVAVSNLSLCSGVTPSGSFYVLTLGLAQTGSDGNAVAPQPGTYTVSNVYSAPLPNQQTATATLQVYGDPSECDHDAVSAGAYCNGQAYVQSVSGTVTITHIVAPAGTNDGAVQGTFSGLRYDGDTAGVTFSEGAFDTNACDIDLEPASNLPVPV